MVFEHVDIAVTLRALLGYAARIAPDYDAKGALVGTRLVPCSPTCSHFHRADALGTEGAWTLMLWLAEHVHSGEDIPVILGLNPSECATVLCALTIYTNEEASAEPTILPRLSTQGLLRLCARVGAESREHERRKAPRRETGAVIHLMSRSVS